MAHAVGIVLTKEIQLCATRSRGSGGQSVNKVSTSVHLFSDIRASSLPDKGQEKTPITGQGYPFQNRENFESVLVCTTKAD